jgi:hypothetical protein
MEARVGKTWAAPTDIDLSRLVRWLGLGGWVLYSAADPVAPTPIPGVAAGGRAEELYAAARRPGLRFIVTSYYDDTYWDIALNSNVE